MGRSSDAAIEAEHSRDCDCEDCEAEAHQRYLDEEGECINGC